MTTVINRRLRRSRWHASSENRLKYEREQGGLAMSTGAQQPSTRLCFFTAGLLYFESNSCSFCDAYCRRRTGSRPERAIGSLWHRHPEGAWKTLLTAILRWLSITWKSVEGGAQILAWVVVTTRYVCPGVLYCSRSYLNRFSLFTYCNERPGLLFINMIT